MLGGWLVQHASWRWVFFINLPIALAVLLILLARPGMRTEERGRKLDWPGALLTTVGLGGIVYALDRIGAGRGRDRRGRRWSRSSSSKRARRRRCCRWRCSARGTFSGANLLTLFLYAALSGVLFFLPLNLIQVQGYTRRPRPAPRCCHSSC